MTVLTEGVFERCSYECSIYLVIGDDSGFRLTLELKVVTRLVGLYPTEMVYFLPELKRFWMAGDCVLST